MVKIKQQISHAGYSTSSIYWWRLFGRLPRIFKMAIIILDFWCVVSDVCAIYM